MDELAAERNAQKLSIRYVSDPRNQFVIHEAGSQGPGLFVDEGGAPSPILSDNLTASDYIELQQGLRVLFR